MNILHQIMETKLFISEHQAVKLSGISRRTFQDLVNEGYIPYIQHNNRRLFRIEWLQNISPNKKAKKQVVPTNITSVNEKKFRNAFEFHQFKEAERQSVSCATNN